MNMKKTIAAVAACAMAVSAMATTVSAVDENATEVKSVHYDLTIKSKARTASVTFMAKSIDAADGTNPYTLVIDLTSVTDANSDVPTAAEVQVTKKGSTAGTAVLAFEADPEKAGYDGMARSSGIKNGKELVIASNTAKTLDTGNEKFSNAAADTTFTVAGPVYDTAQGDGAFTETATNCKKIRGYSITISPKSTIYNAFMNDGADTTTIDVAVTLNGIAVKCDQAGLNTALVGKTAQLYALDTGAQSNVTARGTVTESDVKKPMKTVANTKSSTSEIFTRLGTVGTKSIDSKYVNVPAVINDMVANYDDVVFTFNTATDNVLDKTWLDSVSGWLPDYDTVKRFEDYYIGGVPARETWYGSDRYKSFPQDLYNLFGDEGTGYTYSDSYTFNNLFNAALIANNGYTMNQNSVQPFQYSATSVSFSWADMTGGNSYVSPADAINTLQLATSSLWYWDSMDVKAYEVAAEDAGSGEGADGDGDTIDDGEGDVDDSDIDDSDIDDSDIDDSDIDDTDVDTDVDADVDTDVDADVDADDTTPVEDNPQTGNAPIALAVIPVALAAAAVVAKKRG